MVSLLNVVDSQHFSIRSMNSELVKSYATVPGDQFLDPDDDKVYLVKLQFNGRQFGTFSQIISFDFGTRPVLYSKVLVELGSAETQRRVANTRASVSFERSVAYLMYCALILQFVLGSL